MAAGKDKSSFVDERIDRFGIPVSQKDLLVQIVFNMESFIMAMGAARDWRTRSSKFFTELSSQLKLF